MSMQGLTPMLNGVPVFESIYATTKVPQREHVQKVGQSDNYHKRIQKKWNKRFGWFEKPAAISMPGRLIVHPDVMKRLRHQFQAQGLRP